MFYLPSLRLLLVNNHGRPTPKNTQIVCNRVRAGYRTKEYKSDKKKAKICEINCSDYGSLTTAHSCSFTLNSISSTKSCQCINHFLNYFLNLFLTWKRLAFQQHIVCVVFYSKLYFL